MEKKVKIYIKRRKVLRNEVKYEIILRIQWRFIEGETENERKT